MPFKGTSQPRDQTRFHIAYIIFYATIRETPAQRTRISKQQPWANFVQFVSEECFLYFKMHEEKIL